MLLGLLQAAPASPSAQPFGLLGSPIFLLVLLLPIWYFLLIAPQRKKQKQLQAMLEELKNGDRVVTNGGILGTIVRVNKGEDEVRLRIAPSVEIDIKRVSVVDVVSEPQTGS